MSDELTLYGHWLSQPSAKVGLMLAMTETPHVYRHVDLWVGAQKEPAFVALSPFAQVPVIVHNGTPLSESNVILVYMAVKLGKLDGATPEERLRVREWLSWEADQLFWISRRRAQIRFMKGHEAIVERYGNSASRALSLLDRRLAERDFIVGDNPTITDVACFVTTMLADEAKLDIAEWPNVGAWQKRMLAQPGCAHPYEIMPKEDVG
jgi:glutathione S-transferase